MRFLTSHLDNPERKIAVHLFPDTLKLVMGPCRKGVGPGYVISLSEMVGCSPMMLSPESDVGR